MIVDLDDPAFFQHHQADWTVLRRGAAREARTRPRGRHRGWAGGSGAWLPRTEGFVEIVAIRCLLDAGHVVTGGGGGIPVRTDEGWDGVDAVIDKDSAAAELAAQLQAEALVLITGVDAVQLDFGRTPSGP